MTSINERWCFRLSHRQLAYYHSHYRFLGARCLAAYSRFDITPISSRGNMSWRAPTALIALFTLHHCMSFTAKWCDGALYQYYSQLSFTLLLYCAMLRHLKWALNSSRACDSLPLRIFSLARSRHAVFQRYAKQALLRAFSLYRVALFELLDARLIRQCNDLVIKFSSPFASLTWGADCRAPHYRVRHSYWPSRFLVSAINGISIFVINGRTEIFSISGIINARRAYCRSHSSSSPRQLSGARSRHWPAATPNMSAILMIMPECRLYLLMASWWYLFFTDFTIYSDRLSAAFAQRVELIASSQAPPTSALGWH